MNRTARRVLFTATLGVGTLVATVFWYGFHGFAVKWAPPQPGWNLAITFWYAMPGFQAGVLGGLVLSFARRGVDRFLLVLNQAIWIENAVNVGILIYLGTTAALLF